MFRLSSSLFSRIKRPCVSSSVISADSKGHPRVTIFHSQPDGTGMFIKEQNSHQAWACPAASLTAVINFVAAQGSSLFSWFTLSDSCYCGTLTSFGFLRGRLTCLIPVPASSRQERHLVGVASTAEEETSEGQDTFSSGHFQWGSFIPERLDGAE